MNWKTAKAMRQWIRDYNKLAEKYGHEDAAGTPDDPDPDYVDKFNEGLTPEQVIELDFGDQDQCY